VRSVLIEQASSSGIMKTAITFLIALLLLADMARSQTQRETNADASAELQRAEAELTNVYQKALHYAETDPTLKFQGLSKTVVKNLRQAQKAWIVFRDAHLEAIFPAEKRYSARPMAIAIVQTELTKARIEQLKGWAEGMEEGDITAGTRQTYQAKTSE
jgi:uncharacterized protein YecT (DUF1311 family)